MIEEKNAIDVQIGGDHYKKLPYQPIQLAAKVNLNGFQLFIIKYITRYHNKAGKTDLEKAIHTAQLGEVLNPKNFYPYTPAAEEEVSIFCKNNNLPETISEVVNATVYQNWTEIINKVSKLIEQEYPEIKNN